MPGGAPSTLSTDGRLATAPFTGAPGGSEVAVELSPALTDPSGQPPQTEGPLDFTLGPCAEGSAPNVALASTVAEDVDAWLEFAVDSPGLCGALVADPGSSDAGVAQLAVASCSAPYNPCALDAGGSLCLCEVAIDALGPGDVIQVVPTLLGFDGQLGSGPPTSFQTSAPLPTLVLTEVYPGPKTSAFVEVQNRGAAPLELQGMLLADCGLSLGCSALKSTPLPFGPAGNGGSATLAPNGYALFVDPTFDAPPPRPRARSC